MWKKKKTHNISRDGIYLILDNVNDFFMESNNLYSRNGQGCDISSIQTFCPLTFKGNVKNWWDGIKETTRNEIKGIGVAANTAAIIDNYAHALR